MTTPPPPPNGDGKLEYCPFCGIVPEKSLVWGRTFSHKMGECILSGYEIPIALIPDWNRRVAHPSPSVDIRKDPLGAYATIAVVGMMREEIKRLEAERDNYKGQIEQLRGSAI